MKTSLVTVRFPLGLHARPAAKLIRLFRKFHAEVFLRVGNRITQAGSLMGILLLAATFNTQLEIRASGDDEDAAIQAAEVFFQSADEDALPLIAAEPLPKKHAAERT
jgi:phosphotransferase system HPr (HPr) family protein